MVAAAIYLTAAGAGSPMVRGNEQRRCGQLPAEPPNGTSVASDDAGVVLLLATCSMQP